MPRIACLTAVLAFIAPAAASAATASVNDVGGDPRSGRAFEVVFVAGGGEATV